MFRIILNSISTFFPLQDEQIIKRVIALYDYNHGQAGDLSLTKVTFSLIIFGVIVGAC